ncbi:hypothetical protein IVB14_32735 [Bradyrhizobium sp. 180]|uniref:hypothetical protein n=1 Tax=unclassified Bradyrhizobium TaxID=2631580 RepID=UPI001FF7DF46|nr:MULTISPECIES: hypothetical protein [unclassified Bradyrhizobium]MCK1495045.1 hypothetical protein [Bradyrhizobium sp. 180]
MIDQSEEENAEYDDLLKQLGRTEEQDQRIAIHEAGHAICARVLGHPVGGVTVNPDPVRGSEGMCWGVGHAEAYAAARGDASDVRKAIAPMMPEPGEDRRSVGMCLPAYTTIAPSYWPGGPPSSCCWVMLTVGPLLMICGKPVSWLF